MLTATAAAAARAMATLRLRFVLFEISVYNFFGFDLLKRELSSSAAVPAVSAAPAALDI